MQGGGGFIEFLPMRFLYSPYGLGLSALALVGLAAGVICSKKCEEKLMSAGLLCIFLMPVFGYLLNGGLYNKDKAFIPFLPLVCLQIARYGNRCVENRSDFLKGFLPYGIVLGCILCSEETGRFVIYKPYIAAETGSMFLLYLAGWKTRKKPSKIPWQIALSCIFLFGTGWAVNTSADYMIPREEYMEITSENKGGSMKKILEEDTSLYRMEQLGGGKDNLANINRVWDIRQNISSVYSSFCNKDYQKFRKDIFQINEPFRNDMMLSVSDNPFFLQFMGVKYVQSEKVPAGYEVMEESGAPSMCRSKYAAPIAYVTSQVMGEKEYEALDFPHNQTALLTRAVVPEEREEVVSEKNMGGLDSCTLVLPEMKTESISIRKISGGYEVEAAKETKLYAELSGTKPEDTVFALQFKAENEKPNQDMHIRLSGQTNRLSAANHEYANHNDTFSYVVTLGKDTGKIIVKLGKGKYNIKDIRAFCGNFEQIQAGSSLYQSPLKMGQSDLSGDSLSGTVHTKTGGYLITSIPYDRNFRIYVDGKEKELLNVNKAFIGCMVPKGEHRIEIVYKASGKKTGLVLSGCGILICGCCLLKSRKRGRLAF